METRRDLSASAILDEQLKISILKRAMQLDVSGAPELDGVLKKLVHQIDDGVAGLAVILTRLCMLRSEYIAEELTSGTGMMPA